IGRAAIPPLAELLLCRHDVDELAELAVQIAPTARDMLDQRMRLILREDEYLPNAGVDAVRQRKIDDPVLAAERRRRLRAVVRELLQPLAPTSCHDHGHRASGELTDAPPRDWSHCWCKYRDA